MTSDPHSPDNRKQTGGVTIGDVFGGIWNSIIAGGDVIVQTFTGSEERRAQRNRRAMLQLVKNTWIKGVLEQSLHGAAMIELGMEERADAVERPWDMVIRMPDREDQKLPPSTKIIDVLDEANGALLILGEPGSGKTTMLLVLARDAIARAEVDPMQPIPVVFSLSSWAEERQPIKEWLLKEFKDEYNISERMALPWIENGRLLLLFDGLDEVERKCQTACIQDINDFRGEHGLTPIAICCRVKDYEASKAKLKFQNAVLLRPLTYAQIDHYLREAGPELEGVRKTLQQDRALRNLAQMPLMLSVMTVAYQGASADDLPSRGSRKARRGRIFDAYIDRMFQRFARPDRQPYTREETLQWLAWLAQAMEARSQSTFRIEDMQPDLLEEADERQRYTRCVTWSFRSLVVFVSILVLLALSSSQILWLTGGIITGFVTAWKAAGSLHWKRIQRVEQLGWSWDRAIAALIVGMPLGMVAMRIFGLAAGVTIGRIINLAIVLTSALVGGLLLQDSPEKNRPNQGIRQSGRNALMIFLGVGLIGGLIVGAFAGPIAGTIFGVVVGLVNGLIFGGLASIQHAILRLILYRNDRIPWNLSRFLDYATDRAFLYKVGGGYRFIHRPLQEHFAAMYEETA